jgi:hypothetical protein
MLYHFKVYQTFHSRSQNKESSCQKTEISITNFLYLVMVKNFETQNDDQKIKQFGA